MTVAQSEFVVETERLTKRYFPYFALTAFVTVLALLTNFFSWFQNVADYLLVRNISGWTGAAGGFPGTVLPDQTHAILVLAVYSLVLIGTAFWLFERRDVQGATGG